MSIARNAHRRYLVWQTACFLAATCLTVAWSASGGEVVNKQKDLRPLVVEFFDKNLKPAK